MVVPKSGLLSRFYLKREGDSVKRGGPEFGGKKVNVMMVLVVVYVLTIEQAGG